MTDAPLTNGIHLNGHSVTSSPPAATQPPDSPATPVDDSTSPHIKIDVDYNEAESDLRHEPIPVKVDQLRSASTVPQVGSPVDPSTSCLFISDLTSPHTRSS